MMVMVDVLAQGARGPEPVVALEDVRVKGWLVVDRLRRLRVEKSGDRYRLLSYPINGGEPDSHLGASHLGIAVTEIASARVLTGQYGTPPDRLPSLDGEDSPSPYASGALFHGPSMQVMQSHILGKTGASSILDAQNGVPPGCLNPGLLDGATHAIPHDSLHVWNEKLSPDKVAYPALIPRIDFYGPTPTTGSVTCEVRCSGFMGNRDFPTFEIQLATTTGVWAELQLVEACFPKGTLGAAPSESRRAFLRDQLPIPGLSLSTHEAETTSLELALVEESDWLPGTVSGIYGTRDPVEIAIREHRAAAHGLHPARVTAQLPLTRFEDPAIDHRPGQVVITGDRTGRLDIAIVRDFWDRWFDRARWPVQDIYYGLIDRFIGRIVLEDPAGFEALRGRSVLYLANHQTGIESLLFSIVASALNGVPTITLAKIEHRESWLGRLIQLCFSYPDVVDPEVMMFFDREDKDSLVRIIGQLGAQMAGPGRSVMVHVEGTRALSARHAVSLMSGAFIDMALSVGAAIVPVRFIGGLPVKPLETRTEYPIGMGRQDVWLGRPLQPEQLKPLHYGARKDQIIEGINRLGIPNDQEVPLQGDPEFSNRVRERVSRTGVRHEWAVLWTLLEDLPDPSPGIHDLLNRVGSGALPWESDPESQWFARLEHLLMEG